MEPDEVPNELVSDAYLDKMERVVLNADSADPPTLPNTPDRRRVHDNFTLAAISEIRSLREWVASLESALAARESEVAELREAVESKLAEYERDDAEWRALKGLGDLPHDSALVEDWKAVLAILSRPPGPDSALRAMLTKAVKKSWDGALEYATGGQFDSLTDVEAEGIVSRLLRGRAGRDDACGRGDGRRRGMSGRIGWYYLHTNGELIYKRDLDGTAADIRESDFARALWPVDPSDRLGAWSILIEASAAGALASRVSELAAKWGCDDADAAEAAKAYGIRLYRDGDQWCATKQDFADLATSPAGFGSTALAAFTMLAKELGYRPSKMWGATFADLARSQVAS